MVLDHVLLLGCDLARMSEESTNRWLTQPVADIRGPFSSASSIRHFHHVTVRDQERLLAVRKSVIVSTNCFKVSKLSSLK